MQVHFFQNDQLQTKVRDWVLLARGNSLLLFGNIIYRKVFMRFMAVDKVFALGNIKIMNGVWLLRDSNMDQPNSESASNLCPPTAFVKQIITEKLGTSGGSIGREFDLEICRPRFIWHSKLWPFFYINFFTQYELMEPVLAQAARLGIHFKNIFLSPHTVRDAPPWGTWLRALHWWRDRKKKKIARHVVGFEPTTSLFQGVCSTAVLQPRPSQHHSSKINR